MSILRKGLLLKNITLKETGSLNPKIVISKYSKRFKYDRRNNPKLIKLEKKYALRRVIKSGKTELEKMQLLNDWVMHRFKKFGQPTLPVHNALSILEEIDRGGSFYCAHFAAVFLSAAYSLGWVARGLQLKALPSVTGVEHTICEIWSNQFRKWIELDPTHMVYFVTESTPGIPLSAFEIRKELFRNGGKDLIFISGKQKKKYTLKDLPFYHPPSNTTISFSAISLAKHANMIFAGSARWLDDSINAHPYMLFKGGISSLNNDKDGSFMIIDKYNKKVKWHKKCVVAAKNIRDIYWSLGEAHIELLPKNGRNVAIKLTTQTPNFSHFLVKLNNGAWKKTASGFKWKLKPGINKITATTKNKFGVSGPHNYVCLNHKG